MQNIDKLNKSGTLKNTHRDVLILNIALPNNNVTLKNTIYDVRMQNIEV